MRDLQTHLCSARLCHRGPTLLHPSIRTRTQRKPSSSHSPNLNSMRSSKDIINRRHHSSCSSRNLSRLRLLLGLVRRRYLSLRHTLRRHALWRCLLPFRTPFYSRMKLPHIRPHLKQRA